MGEFSYIQLSQMVDNWCYIGMGCAAVIENNLEAAGSREKCCQEILPFLH